MSDTLPLYLNSYLIELSDRLAVKYTMRMNGAWSSSGLYHVEFGMNVRHSVVYNRGLTVHNTGRRTMPGQGRVTAYYHKQYRPVLWSAAAKAHILLVRKPRRWTAA
jgi:hypothetical protein